MTRRIIATCFVVHSDEREYPEQKRSIGRTKTHPVSYLLLPVLLGLHPDSLNLLFYLINFFLVAAAFVVGYLGAELVNLLLLFPVGCFQSEGEADLWLVMLAGSGQYMVVSSS